MCSRVRGKECKGVFKGEGKGVGIKGCNGVFKR